MHFKYSKKLHLFAQYNLKDFFVFFILVKMFKVNKRKKKENLDTV